MDEIIKQVNWDGDFNSFLNYLRTSPRFYYDNSEDLFNAYLIMSKTIDPLLTKIFKVLSFNTHPITFIVYIEKLSPFYLYFIFLIFLKLTLFIDFGYLLG